MKFSGWWGSAEADASPALRSDSSLKPHGRTVSLLAQGLDLLNIRSASLQAEAGGDADDSPRGGAADEGALSRKSSTALVPLHPHERKRSWSITQSLGLGRKPAAQGRLPDERGEEVLLPEEWIPSPAGYTPPAAPSSVATDDRESSPKILLDDLSFLTGPHGGPLVVRGSADQASPLGASRAPDALLVGGTPPASEKGGVGARGTGVQRTQGYRRLWQSITSGKKGEHGGRGGRHGGEVTVDELVRAVKRLGARQSVMEAVEVDLASLDSRAVAALLKELAKAGLAHRASELFDALRALPPGHPLARLADLYTYTTIISQCGSHQQLRRALELVAEMRVRGIACNVHTYSALMGVAVKCGECDLALDVYQQALDEGLSPNAVTFNILIDVHGRAGRWREAVEVLSEFERHRLAPEPRTYNAVIGICARAGAADAAAGVYERMLRAGAAPSSTTYTSLISAYGKAGRVDDAMTAMRDMSARGLEPNVITYSSLVCAAEKAGRGDLALGVVADMRQRGCRPNVVTYNALLGACGQAGLWREALRAFDAMRAEGCWPDAVSYSLLIVALRRGGAWGPALGAYEAMLASGLRPDAGVLAGLLDALAGPGLVAAVRRGLQAYAAAVAAGHLRGGPSAVGTWQAEAAGAAAAEAAALHWLWTLREAAGGGAAAAAGPDTLRLTLGRGRTAPGLVRTSLTRASPLPGAEAQVVPLGTSTKPAVMRLGNRPGEGGAATPFAAPGALFRPSAGPSAGGDAPPALGRVSASALAGADVAATVERALVALGEALDIPWSVSVNDWAVSVAAPRAALLDWLASPRGALAVAPVAAALASPVVPAAALVEADAAAAEACGAAFRAVQAYEQAHFAAPAPREAPRDATPPATRGSSGASSPHGGAEPAGFAARDKLAAPAPSASAAPARAALAAAVLRLGLVLSMRNEISHDAVQLADRYARQVALPPATVERPAAALALAAIALAAQQAGLAVEESAPGWAPLMGLVGTSAEEVALERQRLVAALSGDTAAISPLRVLQLYFERLGCTVQAVATDAQLQAFMAGAVEQASNAALSPLGPPALPPSVVAAACLQATAARLGIRPAWSATLQKMTGYAEEDVAYAANKIGLAEPLAS